MPLKLLLLDQTTLPIEIEGLVPLALRGKSIAEIERWPARCGRDVVALAEFFKVSGDAREDQLLLEGDLRAVHGLGSGLTEGTIRIEGSAGRHLGAQMRGGTIVVSGDAGDWAGAELRGGLLDIRGRAGDCVGSAYRGSRKGMTGGTILIGRDAGHECGRAMRRGTLAIGGSVGDGLGYDLIAGTILVRGRCGQRPGAGMKRGTLALLDDQPTELLPSFRPSCVYRPTFLRFYFRELARLGWTVSDEVFESDYLRSCGDLLTVGKGEILTRSAPGLG